MAHEGKLAHKILLCGFGSSSEIFKFLRKFYFINLYLGCFLVYFTTFFTVILCVLRFHYVEPLQVYKAARVVSCCDSKSSDNSISQALYSWCSCCLVRTIFIVFESSSLLSESILRARSYSRSFFSKLILAKESIVERFSKLWSMSFFVWFNVLIPRRYTVNLVVFFVEKKLPGLHMWT